MRSYVVTGGGRGIGQDIVRKLSIAGDSVVFYSYLSHPNAYYEDQENIYSCRADCSTYQGCQLFSGFILNHTERIDGLINNVGVAQFDLINNTNSSTWDHIHRTNVDSALFMYQLLLPSLIKAKGLIINISSMVHKSPSKGTGAYASSKSMMADLTKRMSLENENSGVEAITISPGFILTEALKKPVYEGIRRKNLEQIPLNSFGSPKDVSQTVYMLLTRNLSCLNGATVDITGGQHIFSY
jgi:NAD(P)-dependent dehydrogenase (short-subunit alcohol dehydrogenase family)